MWRLKIRGCEPGKKLQPTCADTFHETPSPGYMMSLLQGPTSLSTVPEFVDSFVSGIYKISLICQLCQETNIYYEPFGHITVQPNTDIFSYFQIQIYFHIWLKISVKIKILLVGNALLSLVNLYSQVTKKCDILLIQINRFQCI